MKNKLYCFAAIFLIGSSALRGCAGAASRHIPEFLEKVNPVRIVKEHPGYAYGAKWMVEKIDSIDFDAGTHNRQINYLPSYNYIGRDSRPIDLDLSYQQMRLDNMMNEVNWAVFLSKPIHSPHDNKRIIQPTVMSYDEYLLLFQRSNDSCSVANIWLNPIPLKKAHYLQMNNSYPAN